MFILKSDIITYKNVRILREYTDRKTCLYSINDDNRFKKFNCFRTLNDIKIHINNVLESGVKNNENIR